MKRSLILAITLAITLVLMTSMSLSAVGEYQGAMEPATLSYAISVDDVEPVQAPEIKEDDMADSDIETETEVMYYTEDEVVMMAKLLYRECRGVPSKTQQACVAWSVCNRVDSDEFDGSTITEIVTAKRQFVYRENTPVWDELYDLALDVLTRWNAERNGEVSVGRVLPKDYTFFSGDSERNYFRNAYKGDYSIWDYSLESPYES